MSCKHAHGTQTAKHIKQKHKRKTKHNKRKTIQSTSETKNTNLRKDKS